MQSRPYERSVLRKYYFDEPASTNTVESIYCAERLRTVTGSINGFVYQSRTIRSKCILSVIYYFEDNCTFKAVSHSTSIHLNSIISSELTQYCFKCKHDCNCHAVFILKFLSCIGTILKCRSALNPYRFQFILIGSIIQNVQICIALYYWIPYCILLHLSSLINLRKLVKVKTDLQTLYVLNGSDINSDMEVDEDSKQLNEKSPVIKEETLDLSYEYINNESENPTVIKNVQNMKEPECAQVNNSLNCVNHNDKVDNKYDKSVEMVANGDVVNCHSDNNIAESKKLIDNVNFTTKDENLLDGIKKEFDCSEVNGTDFKSIKINEIESVEEEPTKKLQEIKYEKDADRCSVKLNDTNIEKEKVKVKDHSGNNSTSHSLSTKKGDESWSHHSSSSSSSSRSKYKDYKSSSHRGSSNSKSCERSKTSEGDKKYESSDKKKSSRSCHHKPEEKCHCKCHHHSRHHSKSKKFQSIKTQCVADEIAYELRGNKSDISNPYFTRVPWVPHPQLVKLKYGRFYRLEVDRNGGASVVHLYMDEISHLSESQMKECAVEFIKLSYSEDDNECAYHVMGIVHGAAAYLPDLVDYMADHYPTLIVKTGSLLSRDNHTTTMSQYRDEVYKTYSNGTFRYHPLDQLSICGVLGEEVGAYFPDFVARLEQSPFMKPVMPWSSLSVVETDNPRESNDGPIFWVRPGEQMLPANEALKESARPKKRRNNELDNLAYIAGSRSSEARESLFMDRTKAHADQVGVDYGLSNTAPTAAVGVLKSVNCGHPEHGNRATKDVVAFHAQDYNELLEILMLDLYEPPQTQCTKWIEVSKLNTLRREGIRYAHVQLHDNDVYYLPRKIIHQFQTISSVASVAWHIRYKDYFAIMGAPNLHTPTGINKGQVFYEKKNVAVYYPPVCDNDLLASVTNPGSPLSKTPKKFEKLKDYSPFKHSPRKNHKIHSPRTSSKREKESDSVPKTPNKKEPESASNHEEKSSYVKKERVKSDDDGSSKRERDSSSSKKSDKHETSGNHSSTKKERKDNHDSSSVHRKEVKNLEAEFDSVKKSKSKSSKSKTEHDGRRRSDESKSDSSSRHKRHDESKSKSHSKHDKTSSHKKSNGSSAENSSRSEEKHDKSESLKRRNSDSQDSCCSSKRMKDMNNEKDDIVVENGGIAEFPDACVDGKSVSESDVNFQNSNCKVSEVTESMEVDAENHMRNSCGGNETGETGNVADVRPNNVESGTSDVKSTNVVVAADQTCLSVAKNDPESSDLIGNVSYSRGDSNCVAPDPNPPLPCSSPPSNPPLPPNSPLSDTSAIPTANNEDHHKEESYEPASSPLEEFQPGKTTHRENQDYSTLSKDKNNVDIFQGKKLKKKIVKKESESYDLLGDIMSQMDKKK